MVTINQCETDLIVSQLIPRAGTISCEVGFDNMDEDTMEKTGISPVSENVYSVQYDTATKEILSIREPDLPDEILKIVNAYCMQGINGTSVPEVAALDHESKDGWYHLSWAR